MEAEEVTSKLTAEVTARFESYPRYTAIQARGYRFVLENQGPAAAEDVSFEIRTPIEGEAPHVETKGHSFPTSLDPHQPYKMLCVVVTGTAPSVTLTLPGKMGLATDQDADAHGLLGFAYQPLSYRVPVSYLTLGPVKVRICHYLNTPFKSLLYLVNVPIQPECQVNRACWVKNEICSLDSSPEDHWCVSFFATEEARLSHGNTGLLISLLALPDNRHCLFPSLLPDGFNLQPRVSSSPVVIS